MTKIFDIGNLFKHKNLRSFRRLYTQLNWGDDFNKTMRNVEDALSLVLDLDMGFEATAHEFEDGEYRDTVVIRIFEGVDDSSVGARSWTLAYLDVFADGSYHYVQNSDAKELKEFFGEWDQGIKNIFKNKIPEILKRKNPVRSAKEEKIWKRAVTIVEEKRGYGQKKFDDFDWGLVNHLFQLGVKHGS